MLPALLLVLAARHAGAHYLGLTDTAVEIAEAGVRIVQTLPAAELAELGTSQGSQGDTADRPELQVVVEGWRVVADGAACALASASTRELDALDARQFDLRFHCANVPSMVEALEIEYALADGFEPSHVNLARVFVGRRQLPFRFTHERRVLRLPLQTIVSRAATGLPQSFRQDDPNADLAGADAPAPAAGPVPPDVPVPQGDATAANGADAPEPTGALGAAGRSRGELATIVAIYLPSGIEHIIAGPDHIAFVLALLLVPLPVARLALAVTLFTLAHSVTLGLSYLQILSLPPSVTEPLIALSVAAVGIENLLAHRMAAVLRLREATVFFFGLVHGVGLSYQLGELPSSSPVDALLRLAMFNVGVELGQLAILVFPGLGLIWAVRQRSGKYVTALGSAVLVGLGCFWFINRVGSA